MAQATTFGHSLAFRWSWSARHEHRLAALLLAAFTGLLLLGAVVPQRGSLAPLDYARWRSERAPLSLWLEAVGLTSSPRAPWLPLVGAPLAVLLAQCTTRRSRVLLQQWRMGRLTLASARHIGSVGFHASLLVGMAAVVLSTETRFTGRIELAPGAGLVDEPGRYPVTESGWWSPSPTGLTLRLDKLRLATWPDGSLREHTAEVAALRDDQPITRAVLVRGQPVDIEGTSVSLDSRAGPAVLLTASAPGRPSRTGWVHFPAWEQGAQPDMATVVAVPGTEVRFDARLEGATPGGPETPILVVHPLRSGDGGEVRLVAGDATRLDQVDLRLDRVDAWTSLAVVRDPFASVAVDAFAVGLLCLSVVVLGPFTGAQTRERACPPSK
jgi:hypothetical protein